MRDRVLRRRKGGTHQRDVGEKTKEITRAKERKEKEKAKAKATLGMIPCRPQHKWRQGAFTTS